MSNRKNRNRHNAPQAAKQGGPDQPNQALRIVERAMPMMMAEIRAFRNAVATARNPERPRRTMLVQLCESIEVDGHLSAALDKRRMRVTGMSWRLVDKKGQEVALAKALLEKAAFEELLSMLAEVPTKGPACIMLEPSQDGFPNVSLVPRAHYVPELKGVLIDLGDEQPMFLGGPEHRPFFIHAVQRDAKHLGVLWKAIPDVVFKRSARNAWAEYGELFGQPIRVAKVPPMEKQQLAELDRSLADMGRAAYIRLPYGVEFELAASTGKDAYQVFDQHIQRANTEISKLIEGQTMTSDSGSSLSQSQVHQDTAELYRLEDSRWVQGCINDQVLPALIEHGIALQDLRFEWVEQDELSPEQSLAIDQWLQGNFEIPETHFAAKYAVPLKAKPKALPGVPPPAKSSLTAYSPSACPGCGGRHAGPSMEDNMDSILDKLRAALARLARAIFDGKAATVDWDTMRAAGEALEAATAAGFDLDKLTWDSPDLLAGAVMRSNAWKFAGARTVAEARAIRAELSDTNGSPREWADFRKRALELHAEYFEPWLKSEYDAARMAAIAARQWLDIQGDAEEFPMLEYVTVGDARVRTAHAALDGITLKVGDALWAKIYPPNGWGCRCDVRQRLGDAVATTEGEAQTATAYVAEGWEFNPGKELRFWPNGHAYLGDMQDRTFAEFGFAGADSIRRKDKTPPPIDLEAYTELQAKGTVTGNLGGLPFRLPDALAADSAASRQLLALAGTNPHERWVLPATDGITVRNLWFLDDLLHRIDLLIQDDGATVATFTQDSAAVIHTKRKGTPWPR